MVVLAATLRSTPNHSGCKECAFKKLREKIASGEVITRPKKHSEIESEKHLKVGDKVGKFTVKKLITDRRAIFKCICGQETENYLSNLNQLKGKACRKCAADARIQVQKQLKQGLEKHLDIGIF